ncbi:S9 family peptidase [Rhizosphaericola mali]|uniref:S9 family peptidase n=1 Tax=Rhizosphaericola mali TaxID=2545455 RepID=A0A5P2FWB3_9BACT|nr:prolyl oligopeptidase family serine peptidase [Rhizosphaericola mali]QES87816.1 S9 family peptidase [Rhizosphaericola mali]
MSNRFKCLFSLLTCIPILIFAQKKPLNNTVYDSWQNTSNLSISENGHFVSYEVNPQEGDGILYIQTPKGDTLFKIARGYDGAFLNNKAFFICKIKPTYQQIRTAKIEKKTPEDSPHDSLAIINLNEPFISIHPNIQSYKYSKKQGALVAFLAEKTKAKAEHAPKDSVSRIQILQKEIDSLQNNLTNIQTKGFTAIKPAKKPKIFKEVGTALTIVNLENKDSVVIPFATDYEISDKDNKAIAIVGHDKTDSTYSVAYFSNGKIKTILNNALSIKNPSLNKMGDQATFLVDKDSTEKALRNFYAVYLFNSDKDITSPILTRAHDGMYKNWMISEFANATFSPSGKNLIIGTAPILPLKDTTLPEFERVHLDIWQYNEDDLHSSQLYNLAKDAKKNYKAIYNIEQDKFIQIEDSTFNRVFLTKKGDGQYFYALSDKGNRIEKQWLGQTHTDLYSINPVTGQKTKIFNSLLGMGRPSYTGKYFVFYDEFAKTLNVYNAESTQKKVLTGIKFPIYDEDNDVPAEPNLYGLMGWTKNDSAFYIYDKYDIWTVNPSNGKANQVTNFGRNNKIIVRYENLDPNKEYINTQKPLPVELYYDVTKNNQYATIDLKSGKIIDSVTPLGAYKVANIQKAKNSADYIFTKQNYQTSPNVYYTARADNFIQLSNINQQQSEYNWGSAELYKWKSYTGKLTEGIIYKPEDFDPKKKYPMISYFYERNNETLYNYLAPAPTPSRLNISYFVSRGYVVFVPDIWYTTGHPGLSAYNFIVSGIRSILKLGYVDSTKLGIQGQSWGGYQTAYLITKVPNLFAAAWAGAPVVNMFSAYGGIRWESGMNRQFQYEKTQSRIGKTIWEDPKLYVENSPLFNLPKVKTPVVIMSNDADGAVPWYQGIEMFTDLRRLGKKVWLLNYNGEAHNLMQRKNRKDISIREQQFFDWLLKGEKPATWITSGVPALMKDKTMGL